MSEATMSDQLTRARAALERGDLIAAYDLATQNGEPDDPALGYVEVRALAGLGDWRNGLRRYEAAAVGNLGDVDSLALKGRLLKDAAFAEPANRRAARFAEASKAYAAAHGDDTDYYAPINAAFTALLGGNWKRAQRFADIALAASDKAEPGYWPLATRAEALLILGKTAQAEQALRSASTFADATVMARATTFRQLSVLARALGAAIALDAVRPPRAAHFCGHMFLPDVRAEARISKAVEDAITAEGIGWAFGALASGADIIIAEACLRLGVELHVVQPFDEADFLAASVAPAGSSWLRRYQRCKEAASRTYAASTMHYVEDPHQFAFGSEVAMGLARLRAAQMGSEPVQIAVWDGQPAHGVAGTGADVARWSQTGGRTLVIDGSNLPRANGQATALTRQGPRPRRALRVMAFTDFKGFSSLPEASVPLFWQEVMGRCGKVLAGHAERLVSRNTWGDALYLTFDDVAAAAHALTDLCSALNDLRLDVLGLPSGGGMRIGAHFGAVYEVEDPITGAPNFYGSEVSRAARVEPVTPPGQVWITEPLAAAIAMSVPDAFSCHYVGRIPLAKHYGTEPIYRLERRQGLDPQGPKREPLEVTGSARTSF